MTKPTCLLATLALLAPIAAQRIAVLDGPNAQNLTLRSFDERNLAAPPRTELTGLTILPIDITNRTAQMEFTPGNSRRRTEQGWTYVELPDAGRVYHYRKAASPTRFGYVRIGGDGAVTVIHELASTGGTDPYEPFVGVAADGRHAALLEKSGALLVARLDGGTYASTKAPSRRLALPAGVLVENAAIAVGKSHVFVVTDDDRIRRAPLADGGKLIDLTPAGGTGDRMKDELAMSGDGATVAFLYGPKKLYSIYLLGSAGSARKLPPKPAKYEEPGYLPFAAGGPRLMLNRDASRLLYIDATIRDEIFLLDTNGSTGTTHVTSDANFQPYIGVGIFPSFAANVLVLAVGDPQAFDWFGATTTSRGVVNLTQTGNRKTAPFASGTLRPNLAFLAGDLALLSVEQTGPTSFGLRRIDPVTGRSRILARQLRQSPSKGAALGGAPTLLIPAQAGDLLLGRSPSTGILRAPPGTAMSTEAVARNGAFSVFLVTDRNTGFAVPVLRLTGANLLVGPLENGLRQVALTKRDGALLNGRTLRYVSATQARTLAGATTIRVVVSGASH